MKYRPDIVNALKQTALSLSSSAVCRYFTNKDLINIVSIERRRQQIYDNYLWIRNKYWRNKKIYFDFFFHGNRTIIMLIIIIQLYTLPCLRQKKLKTNSKNYAAII